MLVLKGHCCPQEMQRRHFFCSSPHFFRIQGCLHNIVLHFSVLCSEQHFRFLHNVSLFSVCYFSAGGPALYVPTMASDSVVIDIYRLYKAVNDHGGLQQVRSSNRYCSAFVGVFLLFQLWTAICRLSWCYLKCFHLVNFEASLLLLQVYPR